MLCVSALSILIIVVFNSKSGNSNISLCLVLVIALSLKIVGVCLLLICFVTLFLIARDDVLCNKTAVNRLLWFGGEIGERGKCSMVLKLGLSPLVSLCL